MRPALSLRGSSPRSALCAACTLATAAICFSSGSDLGFSSALTQGLADQLAGRFGTPAKARLGAWQKLVGSLRGPASEAPPDKRALEVVAAVNRFFNQVPFVDDLKHWGVVDYWASPAELVASHGADCEDFSIAKYFALKEIGIPVAHLRITYVKSTRLNQPHMVLVYHPGEDADPLVLDNLEDAIRPALQRPDLIPVYAFNDDDVRIVKSGVQASPTQIRVWRGLLEKLERERRT